MDGTDSGAVRAHGEIGHIEIYLKQQGDKFGTELIL